MSLKSTVETLEKDGKYVLVFLPLTLSIFHTFNYFYCSLGTNKCLLDHILRLRTPNL